MNEPRPIVMAAVSDLRRLSRAMGYRKDARVPSIKMNDKKYKISTESPRRYVYCAAPCEGDHKRKESTPTVCAEGPLVKNGGGKARTHPMNAIALAPTNKLLRANACLPTSLFHKEGSIMKSPANISTDAA